MIRNTTLFRLPRSLGCASVLMLTCSAAIGCKEEAADGGRKPPPPPPAAASAGACAKPGKPADPKNVAMLPAKLPTGDFCLDPTGSDQAYGEGSGQPIDGICDLFDGECEIYKRHGVERVVEVRYVDGGGSGATIDVYLSRYSSREKAYAMFTKRVVGDGDPAHPDTPKPIKGGGAAALGLGNAYLWKDTHLVEMTYSDTAAASEQAVKAKADKLLPGLAAELGAKLPGETKVPAAVALLPSPQRLPLGVRFVREKALGVKGAGPGAYGYYQDGDKRWRVLAMVATEQAQAEDVFKTFGKLEGATEEKGLADDAIRVVVADRGPEAEWLIARKGVTILGIGDENRVLRSGMSADEHGAKTLSREEKKERLIALLKSGE